MVKALLCRPVRDVELLAKSALDDCTMLNDLLMYRGPKPVNCRMPPAPPLPDPGTGPGWSRRAQARKDLDHWRRVRDQLQMRAMDAGLL